MIGRSIAQRQRQKIIHAGEEPVLKVVNAGDGDKLHNINFEVYPGEILGLAGLVGSGRTELAWLLFGLSKLKSGEIYYKGSLLGSMNPAGAIFLIALGTSLAVAIISLSFQSQAMSLEKLEDRRKLAKTMTRACIYLAIFGLTLLLTHYPTPDRSKTVRFHFSGDSLYRIEMRLKPDEGQTRKQLYDACQARYAEFYAGVPERTATRWSDGTVTAQLKLTSDGVELSFTCNAAKR